MGLLCSSFIFCFLVWHSGHGCALCSPLCCIWKIKRDTNMSPSQFFSSWVFYFKWMPRSAPFPFSVFPFMSIVCYGYRGYVGALHCYVSCCTRRNKDVTRSVAPHNFSNYSWALCFASIEHHAFLPFPFLLLCLAFIFCFSICYGGLALCIFFVVQRRTTRMWKTSPSNIFLFSTFIFCFKWAPCQVAFPSCVFLLSFCLLLFVHHGGHGCALCWCSSLCCATRNNKGARNIMPPNFSQLSFSIEHMNIKPNYINRSLWLL